MQNDLTGKTVLIVDDDVSLTQIITVVFEGEGCRVYTALDGQSGLQKFFKLRPDLVILDVRLPDIDGWEICRQIRLLSPVAVLMLTTLRENKDLVRSLDQGADDFLSKPFSMEVLLARSRALLRRILAEPVTTAGYSDDYLSVDLDRHRVLVQGRPVKLTATEFRLLATLVRNAGHVLTYEQILQRVWGEAYRDCTDYVHVYLSHLRRKLEQDPQQPRYLLTEHGVGCSFDGRAPVVR